MKHTVVLLISVVMLIGLNGPANADNIAAYKLMINRKGVPPDIYLTPLGAHVIVDYIFMVQMDDRLYGDMHHDFLLRLSGDETSCAYSGLGDYGQPGTAIYQDGVERIVDSKAHAISLNFDASRYSLLFSDRNYAWTLALGERKYGPYMKAHLASFSRDGSAFAFSYYDERVIDLPFNCVFRHFWRTGGGMLFPSASPKQGKWYVRINNTVFGGFDSLGIDYLGQEDYESPVELGDDGKLFAWAHRNGESYFITVGDKRFGPYAYINYNTILASRGKRYGFRYSTKRMHMGKQDVYVMIDGNVHGPYDGPLQVDVPVIYRRNKAFSSKQRYYRFSYGNPVFSDNGASYSFCYLYGGKYYYMMNDVSEGPFNALTVPVMSPDGTQVAVATLEENNQCIRFHGKKYGPFNRIVQVRVSNSGKLGVAYRSNNSKGEDYFIDINGTRKGPFMRADMTLSGNDTFVYAFLKGRAVYRVETR